MVADDKTTNPLKKLTAASKHIWNDEKEMPKPEWLASNEEEPIEGQLAVDVYQTPDDVIIKAPIAGVKPEDLDIAITDEVVTVKGERKEDAIEVNREYFSQECYWGVFSRVYQLPVSVDAEKAQATLKDGILTLVLPKVERLRTRVVKVEAA